MNNPSTPFFSITHKEVRRDFWIEVVDLRTLQISDYRQRNFGRPWCNEIKEDFDPRKVRITAVRRRDGSLWIIGGQHCRVAAMELGIGHFPITIVEADNLEDEVGLLYGLNQSKPLTPPEKTDQRIGRGDAGARNAVRLLEGFGLIHDRKSRAWNAVKDPAIVERLTNIHGEQHAREVLQFIIAAWSGKSECTSKQNIWAISSLIRNWRTKAGAAPHKELVAVVADIHPKTLATKASRMPYFEKTGCVQKRGGFMARFIVDEFNKNRKSNRLTYIG